MLCHIWHMFAYNVKRLTIKKNRPFSIEKHDLISTRIQKEKIY